MDRALQTLLERYPWVADGFSESDASDDPPKAPPRPKTGTSPKSKVNNGRMESAAFKERFPALRNRTRKA